MPEKYKGKLPMDERESQNMKEINKKHQRNVSLSLVVNGPLDLFMRSCSSFVKFLPVCLS